MVGYNTRDEALVLEHKGRPWNPSLIMVGYVLNDPETDPIQAASSLLHGTALVAASEPVLRLLAASWNKWEIQTLGDGDYTRYLHARSADKWASVLEAFSDIRRVANEFDAPVILVVFPLIKTHGWSDYPYRDLHSQVVDAGESMGFHTLDLYDVFSRYEPGADQA